MHLKQKLQLSDRGSEAHMDPTARDLPSRAARARQRHRVWQGSEATEGRLSSARGNGAQRAPSSRRRQVREQPIKTAELKLPDPAKTAQAPMLHAKVLIEKKRLGHQSETTAERFRSTSE